MKCQLIQTRKIDDQNTAEREMLAFLAQLPADYFVYRELQLTPEYRRRLDGMEKQQPDFVVVAPKLGILSIEVKDWNLTANQYEWQDQYKIKVTSLKDGSERQIGNPAAQADSYLHALRELVSGLGVFVASTVAFPRIARAGFLNRLDNINVLQNPQSRFYLDLNRVLFKDDLDRYAAHPEELLTKIANKFPTHFASGAGETDRAKERLLPSSFRIGHYSKRQANQQRLQMLTEKQQRWVFGLDGKANFLLDVAGSGKTNALISRAIHLVDQAGPDASIRILLTTYSRNLQINISRIFSSKIDGSPDLARYRNAIVVECVPVLLEGIVATVLGLAEMSEYRTVGETPQNYEDRLRVDVDSILRQDPERFRQFDHVFIDEIQDFDDFDLQVLSHLGHSFFFVGDIGQKISERSHDLSRLGLVTGDIELSKSYKMHRTPRYIAELATRFILKDPVVRKEFNNRGYTEEFQYPNTIANRAELLRTAKSEVDIPRRLRAYLDGGHTESDLMVITSAGRVKAMQAALQSTGLVSEIGEPKAESAISVVDFVDVKGLEREVVIVTGIEDLYDRSKSQAMFDDEDAKHAREVLSRCQIYVALTRPLEELIIYYQDPANRFVSDLLDIDRQWIEKR